MAGISTPTLDLTVLPPAGPLVVAVSGGCDSMALWALLASSGRWQLTIWHLDHGIRSASAADAELIRACPLPGTRVIERADIPALARAWHCGLEEAGRRQRYARLSEVARGVGAPAIALAHHRDDQAETIVMNLLRGSYGLAGMPARRELATGIAVARPLLAVARAQLRAWATATGLSWHDDATNHDQRFTRNRLRHAVLPVFEAGCPGFTETLVASVRRSETPLRTWLRAHKLPVSRAIIVRLEALAPGARTTLGGRLITRITDGWHDEPEKPTYPGPVTIRPALPAELAAPRRHLVVAGITSPLVCRPAQPGEQWRPLGAPGQQAVFATLAARKVPARQRAVARVVADAHGPVWVEHCTIADRVRVRPGSDPATAYAIVVEP